MLTEEIIISLGFKRLKHFTVANHHILPLTRDRHLSISSLGTPNEMLFISEIENSEICYGKDCVVLHNYDYDGYLTKEKLEILLSFFKDQKDR